MLLDTDEILAQGFLGIIEHFGWKRVSIIVQDETLFSAVRNVAISCKIEVVLISRFPLLP